MSGLWTIGGCVSPMESGADLPAARSEVSSCQLAHFETKGQAAMPPCAAGDCIVPVFVCIVANSIQYSK